MAICFLVLIQRRKPNMQLTSAPCNIWHLECAVKCLDLMYTISFSDIVRDFPAQRVRHYGASDFVYIFIGIEKKEKFFHHISHYDLRVFFSLLFIRFDLRCSTIFHVYTRYAIYCDVTFFRSMCSSMHDITHAARFFSFRSFLFWVHNYCVVFDCHCFTHTHTHRTLHHIPIIQFGRLI